MRKVKLIDSKTELELIEQIGNKLLSDGYNASNSIIITVSTDYSSIAGQLLRHQLSFNGEVVNGFGIDVPYPDEEWNEQYVDSMHKIFNINGSIFFRKNLILVEAGVIRGSNYQYVIDYMRKRLALDNKIVTVALFENISSKFESDYVGEYYDNEFEDLTFWWEKENNHWK